MMKTLFFKYISILAIVVLASCNKGDSVTATSSSPATPKTPDNVIVTTNPTLLISLSKTQITADGVDKVTITVKDDSFTDVTAASVIYVNDKALTTNIFTTLTPGSYQVKAVKGTVSAPVVNLIATSLAVTSVFTQKVLAEFFTGTWCGICPGTLIPMDNYTASNPNTIMVGVHGPNGSGDPYQYIYDTQLRNAFNVAGVPTVLLNRSTNWDSNTATLDQLSQKTALIGIGIETGINGNSIAIKTKVKFATTITAPLKLVVMLVEDGLRYDQANYGHFNLPNPISGFTHRNVLRSTATDIFGDLLPAVQQIKDNTWQKDLSIDASKYDLSKCRIVAFVLYDSNTQGLKGVLNAQIVSAGQNINF